jgi:ATP-binding cassette, subfamily B, multidrug efflux pump
MNQEAIDDSRKDETKPGENAPRLMRFGWWDKVKWIAGYYARHPYVLFVLLFFTILHAASMVVQPIIFRNVIDSLREDPGVLANYDDLVTKALVERGWTSAGDLTWVFLGFATLSFLIYLIVQNHRAWMNTRLEMEFRQEVFADITELGPRFYGKFNTGDLVTRLTDDVAEKLSWFACSGIFRFYEALLLVGFGIAVMLTLHVKLTLITIAPLPLLIVLYGMSSTKLDRRYDYLQSRISKLNDLMDACFSGIRVIKAYRQESAQRKRFADVVEDRRTAEISAVRAQTVIESFYTYVPEFGIALALLAGGYMVIQGEITLGGFLAFDYFVMLLVFPMLDIGQFLVKGLQSAVSIDRLMELQSYRESKVNTGVRDIPADVRGEVIFESVSLSLSEERTALDGVSFTIAAGQTVALVGKVGSGKSWTANLIPRLIDPDTGVVKIDGIPVTELRLDKLREIIGFVSQEPALFSDTIENNILFGRENIAAADIEWAIEVSQLKSELERFPLGLQTGVGTRGLTISGGQKQRVAMARALVTKPMILILDDCTSALDARTEDELWEALNSLPYPTTNIVITHRTATLRAVDRILLFDNGKIVADGTHDQLMAEGALYAELYRHDKLVEAV